MYEVEECSVSAKKNNNGLLKDQIPVGILKHYQSKGIMSEAQIYLNE